MKTKLLFFALFIGSITNSFSQTAIVITLPNNATPTVTVNAAAQTGPITYNFAAASSLQIINNTTDSNYQIRFFDNQTEKFLIPTSSIPASGTTNFTIDTAGKLTPALPGGIISAGDGIKIFKAGTEIFRIQPQAGPANPSAATGNSQNTIANTREAAVEEIIKKNNYTYYSNQNIIVDHNGIIQIFLDENGNPLYADIPLMAKENRDKFKFHVVTDEEAIFTVAVTGTFTPVQISDEINTNVPNAQSATARPFIDHASPIFGPYTGTFVFTLKKNNAVVTTRTVKLLKTNRVSLGTSVIASWLKNPENIATYVKANGETTLIADNPDSRGYLGLFLTFHFVPRNLNIPPRTLVERTGMSIGTNLTDKSFSNFFLGLNVEITNGLFINGGVHYGQVNYVVGYDDFDFGNDVFVGPLTTRKKWDLGGPYLSINVDTALFAKVFSKMMGTSTSP